MGGAIKTRERALKRNVEASDNMDGLKTIKELAQTRTHGDRLKYKAGCRCTPCRAANSRYETERAQIRKRRGPNNIVSAGRTRQRLQALSRKGIGTRTIADATGVGRTILTGIKTGKRKNVRRYTEQAVLALRPADILPDSALVDAQPTWTRINWLLKEGFTKRELAKRLGYKSPALQINRDTVTAKTELRIKLFYKAIRAGE